MATQDELRAFVERYCAIVSAQDLEAYLALFDEQAVQRDPANVPANVGRDAIATFFQTTVVPAEAIAFTAPGVHTCGNQVAIDFTVDVTLGGGKMSISGIEAFTLNGQGLITEAVAYWDDRDVTAG